MAKSLQLLTGAAIAAAAPIAAVPLLLAPTPAHAARQADSTGAEVANFYRARGGAPLWFSPRSGNAAQQLLTLLSTARADNLNPSRYNLKGVARAIQAAQRGDVGRSEQVLSQAFVAFARDVRHDPGGVIYVDAQLKPTPPSAAALLSQAAAAPNLADYVENEGWMSPIYGKLRLALASRLYRSERERQLLALNLERARALPADKGRYVIVNAPAARLYMYENGQVVDSMRVVAGRPDPVAQTPMMNAFIRFVALNPYWNSPADLTRKLLAPRVIKGGRAYLNDKGYEVLSGWGDDAKVINPASVDWQAVASGRDTQIRLRQKPGPKNSMGKMKFMFPNAQGIWLHDTPEQEKIDEAARLQSNGCVRLEDAARFARWLFNGRAPKPQGARPEQKVNLPQLVPVYLTYLTAVPSGTSIVYFDDFYGKDRARLSRMASR